MKTDRFSRAAAARAKAEGGATMSVQKTAPPLVYQHCGLPAKEARAVRIAAARAGLSVSAWMRELVRAELGRGKGDR